jgi:signal transduction histidine kinase
MIFFAQSNVQGYTIRFFDGLFAPVERYVVYVLMAFSGITGLRFISRYLEIDKYAPKAKIILKTTVVVYWCTIPIALTDNFNIAHQILLIVGSFIGPTILYISYYCYRRGNSGALSLLLAWSVFFVGVLIFALKDFGVLPYNDWTHNTMTIGSAIEGILLSFGLADKINVLKREKEEAQVRELGALKMSEVRLEAEVRERTHELYEAKEKIELQFQDLQKSQRQLVESEKMAGLGQMTAGIAHELNNPINFVSSNVAPLEKDIEEILEILTDFKNLPHEPTSPEIEAVRAKFRDYDVSMLETEIKTLLAGIREGSTRASDIVSGLRIFARTDQDVFVDANVNDCVDATLVLIKSTYKNEVNLTRQTDSALPNIDCLPGKLNQVLVNLIGNAVQATIESHTIRQDRKVDVRTWHDEEYIHLSVSDNGPGIPEELQSKIFEPFFTTKKVGQGTGLGLSISKSIIEDHHGTLEVESTVGQGCTFIITLPRKRAMRQQAA